jgi:hypothetical protein
MQIISWSASNHVVVIFPCTGETIYQGCDQRQWTISAGNSLLEHPLYFSPELSSRVRSMQTKIAGSGRWRTISNASRHVKMRFLAAEHILHYMLSDVCGRSEAVVRKWVVHPLRYGISRS